MAYHDIALHCNEHWAKKWGKVIKEMHNHIENCLHVRKFKNMGSFLE